MAIIQFNNDENKYNIELAIYPSNEFNRIIITFKSLEDIPQSITNGFVELNENNNIVQSDFSEYKYIYRKVDEGLSYILTDNENDVYIEEEIIVTPPNEENSDIDNEDNVVEEYVPTLDDVLGFKINEFSSICNRLIEFGVDVEIDGTVEHFSATEKDQMNIKELFDLAIQTNSPMYYHADGKSCKEYSVEQLIDLYFAVCANKMHHTTYFNQAKLYINTLTDIEKINALEYGFTLTEEYLDTYNKAMVQAQKSLDTLIASRVVTEDEVVEEPTETVE